MAAKKKKSGGGSKGNASSSSATSANSSAAAAKQKQKRSTSSSALNADVGGDGLAAELPDGYFIKRMPADGNCLFSAVDDQVACVLESDPGALSTRRWSNFLASCSSLAQSASPVEEGAPAPPASLSSLLGSAAARMAASTTKGIPRGQAELRAAAALWIASHPTTFAPFLGDGDPRVVAFRYADRISRDAAWGGQAEQVALCQLLGVRLRIFQAGQAPWVIAPPLPEPETGGGGAGGGRGEGEGEEEGEGWEKPKKTNKKKKSGGGGGGGKDSSRGASENGNGDFEEVLPVINVSYHHGEHYNSVVRHPLGAREAAAAAAARHLRDKEAVAKALAALGDLDGDGGDGDGGGGGSGSSKKKKKKKQQQQQQEEEQKAEASSEEQEERRDESGGGGGASKEGQEQEQEEEREEEARDPSSPQQQQLRKNDPCACGSALRYKSCCRPRDRARSRAAALAEAAGVDVSEARKLAGDGDELAARLQNELVV